MKVFVYFNLNKKTFSLRALEGPQKGRVVAYRNDIVLIDVVYKVSEAGRQRVLREQTKNVHAGVVGEWDESQDTSRTLAQCLQNGARVSYDPYVNAFFFDVNTGAAVMYSAAVALQCRNRKAFVFAIR